MKTKTKFLVAALTAAGIVAPLQQAWADTITGPVVVPALPQSVAPGVYSVTYPVVVTPTGGTPQALSFIYNSNDTWTAPSGWTFLGQLNNDANTAVFGTTLADGSNLSIALSSTGATQFVPGQTGSVVTPPSVGLTVANRPVSGTVLSGFGASTATGQIQGTGSTTATLVAAPTSVQVVGLNPGGTPPATATVGTGAVSPTSATAAPGFAVGSVAVNSNQPNQSIGWGQYTVTVPNTPTPAGTTTVAATVAGSSGSVGPSGIAINNISGSGTYNVNTGDINATPVETAVFSVDTSGNTYVGGTLTVDGASTTSGITNNGALVNNGNVTVNGNQTVSGTLGVTGQTNTNGIVNTGNTRTSTLTVTGASTTTGITNTGNITNSGAINTATLATTGNATVGGTLGVTGATTTNGITNTGNVATTTLSTTGNATVGGALAVTGASTLSGNTSVGGNLSVAGTSTLTGNTTVGGTLGVTGAATLNGATQVNNTLGVSGAATLNGATQINNTLGVTGATTIGSASGTGGNTATINSSGIVLSTPGLGANNVTVNSSGSSITGGGATLAMASGRATFAGANGTPIRVTGIADGSSDFDAVNYRQYQDLNDRMKAGVAGTAAMANIPQVDAGKMFALGVGVGGFDGEAAVAIGGSMRLWKDGVLKASVGFTSEDATWGIGGAWNW